MFFQRWQLIEAPSSTTFFLIYGCQSVRYEMRFWKVSHRIIVATILFLSDFIIINDTTIEQWQRIVFQSRLIRVWNRIWFHRGCYSCYSLDCVHLIISKWTAALSNGYRNAREWKWTSMCQFLECIRSITIRLKMCSKNDGLYTAYAVIKKW